MTGGRADHLSHKVMRRNRVIFWLLFSLAASLLAIVILVPVEVRVIAPGNISGDAQIVEVRATDSGTVRVVHVRNGQRVAAGDALIALDDQSLNAQRSLLIDKIEQLEIQIAAESAELDLLRRTDRQIFAAIDASEPQALQPLREFAPAGEQYRMRLLVSSLDLALTRAAHTVGHLQGLDEQIVFSSRQLALLEQDRDAAQSLLEKGGASETGLRSIQRAVEDQRLDLSRLRSERQRLIDNGEDLRKQAYLQFVERVDALETSVKEKAQSLTDQKLRLRDVESSLERRVVRSQVEGIVVDMNDLVAANFVRESEIMLRIMPLARLRRVQARVAMDDIDKVNRQASAMIRFPTNTSLRDTLIEAVITKINPVATTTDAPVPERFYEVFLQVEDPRYDPGSARIFSDAPVDVLFSSERTTIARALLRPLTKNWPRIFEQ